MIVVSSGLRSSWLKATGSFSLDYCADIDALHLQLDVYCSTWSWDVTTVVDTYQDTFVIWGNFVFQTNLGAFRMIFVEVGSWNLWKFQESLCRIQASRKGLDSFVWRFPKNWLCSWGRPEIWWRCYDIWLQGSPWFRSIAWFLLDSARLGYRFSGRSSFELQ